MSINESIFGKNKNALELELAFQFSKGENARDGICAVIIGKMAELNGRQSAIKSTELSRKMACSIKYNEC